MGVVESFGGYVSRGGGCGIDRWVGVLSVEEVVGLVICVVTIGVVFEFELCVCGGCSRCELRFGLCGLFCLFCLLTSVCFFR